MTEHDYHGDGNASTFFFISGQNKSFQELIHFFITVTFGGHRDKISFPEETEHGSWVKIQRKQKLFSH